MPHCLFPRRAPKGSTGPPSPSGSGAEAGDLNITHSSSPLISVLSVDNRHESSIIPTTRSTFSPISTTLKPQSRSFTNTSSAMNEGLLRVIPGSVSSVSVVPFSVSLPPPRHLTNTRPKHQDVRPPLVRAEETDPNSTSYLTFTRSLNATPSVVFRPGTADTFGGSDCFASNIRPGTSDSAHSASSTITERGKLYHSPLSGS